jgi:hypothetical protein
MRRWRFDPTLLLVTASFAAALLAAGAAVADSGLPRSDRPADAVVYFIAPSAGETVQSPVTVRFGLREMGVAPAGVERAGTGHHHLIIDAELPPLDLPVPATEQYRHFGLGQTEIVLELPPGEHSLQLLLGDHLHIPHDPAVVSERISISVEE